MITITKNNNNNNNNNIIIIIVSIHSSNEISLYNSIASLVQFSTPQI